MLSGCGGGGAASEQDMRDNLRPTTVTLKDGTYVQCVVFQSINEGGIWCKENPRSGIKPYPAERQR